MILLILALFFMIFSAICLLCMWKIGFPRCIWHAVAGSVGLMIAAALLGFYYG